MERAFFKLLASVIIFLIFQILNFFIVQIISLIVSFLIYNLIMLIFPIVIPPTFILIIASAIVCLIFFEVLGEIDIAILENMPYIKRKLFLLGNFLPLVVLNFLATVALILIIINVDSSELFYQEPNANIAFIVLPFIGSVLTYIITSLKSVKKCNQCNKCGFALFKVCKVKVLDSWKEKTGTGDSYSSVNLTDSSGNTYSGSVYCGTYDKYDEYEKREKVAKCKCCNNTFSLIGEYRIGFLRKLVDKFTFKKGKDDK